ncbi:uncharacterized mitochondrial protein AtMg00810-like [Nicotiana tomentosiformis]|uniref:uncharacterized mitochondrial protein AtMg00810-like n=1 Tax=Nicotiana tomentosiformis TaxID=4098 RepID=UPI00388CE741
MGSEFEMSMMGELNFFLGLQIKQNSNGNMIHQKKYVKELLKRFKIEDSKEIDTHITTTTKLDIDEPGSSVDQKLFQASPKESHLTVVKGILRYLKGTTDFYL